MKSILLSQLGNKNIRCSVTYLVRKLSVECFCYSPLKGSFSIDLLWDITSIIPVCCKKASVRDM